MNPDDLLDALGEIDPALLTGAEQARKKRKKPLLLPLAACLALAVTLFAFRAVRPGPDQVAAGGPQTSRPETGGPMTAPSQSFSAPAEQTTAPAATKPPAPATGTDGQPHDAGTDGQAPAAGLDPSADGLPGDFIIKDEALKLTVTITEAAEDGFFVQVDDAGPGGTQLVGEIVLVRLAEGLIPDRPWSPGDTVTLVCQPRDPDGSYLVIDIEGGET